MSLMFDSNLLKRYDKFPLQMEYNIHVNAHNNYPNNFPFTFGSGKAIWNILKLLTLGCNPGTQQVDPGGASPTN